MRLLKMGTVKLRNETKIIGNNNEFIACQTDIVRTLCQGVTAFTYWIKDSTYSAISLLSLISLM